MRSEPGAQALAKAGDEVVVGIWSFNIGRRLER